MGNEAKDGPSKYFSVVNGTGTGTKPCRLYDDDDDDDEDDDDGGGGGDDDDDDDDKLLRKTKLLQNEYCPLHHV